MRSLEARNADRASVYVTNAVKHFVMATVHLSSLLRAPDEETRRRETDRFVKDLRAVARLARQFHGK